MADPQYTPEQLALIDRYYRSIGVSAETLAKRTAEIKKDTAAFASDLEAAERYFNDLEFTARDLAKTFKNVKNDLLGVKDNAKEGVNAFKKLNDIAESVARHQEDTNRLSVKELENLKKKYTSNNLTLQQNIKEIEAKVRSLKEGEELLGLEKALYEEYVKANLVGDERVDIEALLGKKIDEAIDAETKFQKSLNVSNALLHGTVGLMDKLGLSTFSTVLNIEDAQHKFEELRRSGKTQTEALNEAFKELGEGAERALTDPVTKMAISLAIAKKAFNSFANDIKAVYHEFLEVNKEVAGVGRALGTSSENAHHMVMEAKAAGRAMNDVAFIGKDYAKTMNAAAESLGLQVNLGGETYHELTKMTEQMSLSNEESAQIYKLSKLNNQELSNTNKTIAAGIVAAQKQYNIQVNAKQVFQAIGKLSAATLANFKQNPEALAKAVVQAKALGSDLDKMDAAAQSLLNFEESIQNELEAELLTGKQINLENARAAALNNDQVGYMNAIAKETGDLAEFNKKNRLQQEALAKAFGMSRADLASMLQDQEVYNKLGDISGKTAEEQLAIAHERGLSEEDSLVKSLQQQASSEKFAKAMESVKETIAELVEGPLGKMVGSIADMLNNTKALGALIGFMAFGSILKLVAGIVAAGKFMRELKLLTKGTAIAQVVASAVANPLTALAGVAVAGIAAASIGAMLADDMYSGYGERTLVTPKGSYALNNNDTVIAGTNLFKGNDVISGPVDSINLTGGIESKLDNLANAIRNQPVMVKATIGPNQLLNLQTAQSQYGAPTLFV